MKKFIKLVLRKRMPSTGQIERENINGNEYNYATSGNKKKLKLKLEVHLILIGANTIWRGNVSR